MSYSGLFKSGADDLLLLTFVFHRIDVIEGWEAAISFCEDIMLKKKSTESERGDEGDVVAAASSPIVA